MSETATAAPTDAGTQEQVAAPAEQAQKPAGKQKTGNLLFDTAVEINGLTKTKALNLAIKLAEDIDSNSFRLGGVLHEISKQQWYDGFPTFDAYVAEKFGFAVRKAHYLISIYTNLVDKQIPWEKVQHLGWTKIKDLAPILTLENMDAWIAKADAVTVLELQALIKAPTEAGTQDGASTAGTTSNIVKMNFKLHSEQAEQVQAALAKAKAEAQTEHDNVALAAICGGYLANATGVASTQVDMQALFAQVGFEHVLGVFEQVFPNVNLTVDMGEGEPATEGAEAAPAAA